MDIGPQAACIGAVTNNAEMLNGFRRVVRGEASTERLRRRRETFAHCLFCCDVEMWFGLLPRDTNSANQDRQTSSNAKYHFILGTFNPISGLNMDFKPVYA